MWDNMRMSPTDILDVSGAIYTCLMNGQPPAANWTALFRPDERVRLRFIDAGTMSVFTAGVRTWFLKGSWTLEVDQSGDARKAHKYQCRHISAQTHGDFL